MSEFSFYFNFQRITNCDPDYLKELYKDEPDGEEIIEGILRDRAKWGGNHENQEIFDLPPETLAIDDSGINSLEFEIFGDSALSASADAVLDEQ